ncbi:ABC transporter substrate-binding protein [Acidocella aromatica]|uniref:NitT/TauT family transport system substrate-binding protein n=1 Tax=Acidocella aromatica TaxID=1303579 RepID=A0A840VDA9_9PROT|nr:ABC transporter substrate-binding protein [Acidocella aromatica]MBB5372847.1 NitT/TauT family transport system substrate-binding protein [Acidocella aromatica]
MFRPVRWLGAALAALLAPTAHAADTVSFGLDWVAEPEYGGYYQALATGIYQKYGLDVHIVQGGPQVNNAQLLIAGRLTFDITSNAFLALNFAQENIPFVAVAAGFQKDPDALIAHPGQGNDSFASLKGMPIAVSTDTRASWWIFLKAKYGYSDDQLRPYGFSLTPFFTNPQDVQEAYVTSEPYLVHQQTGQWPVVLALPDAGFDGYASLIATSRKLVDGNPDLVKRFIEASTEGWYSFLYSNPAPAFAAIKAANPDMTDGLMRFGYEQLKARGIVDSGDTKRLGIYAMTDARWASFFNQMAEAGLYDKSMDYKAGYTLQFVDHGFGVQK